MKKSLLSFFLAVFSTMVLSAQITITEIFYNAPNAGSDTIEYIELYNNSTAMVDLHGYYFAEGVNYTFPANSNIAAGEYIVVANDAVVMNDLLGVTAYEWLTGGLNNDGEDIQLNDSFNIMVDYVDYLDGGLWPVTADGDGYSMELCDPDVDNTNPMNWSASTTSTTILVESVLLYGTPGAANDISCPVPDVTVTASNTIFTPSDITITVGQTVEWTNAGGNHNVNGSIATFPSNPEGFSNGLASTAAWTFSHTFTTVGVYDYQCDPHAGLGMVGTVTVLPAPIGDIVINEIMYNPPGSDAIGEYLELYNKSSSPVDLSGYSFTAGISHTFDGVTLGAGEYLVLAADSAAIESIYGITPRQWTSGGLTNAGEDIVLIDGAGDIVDVVNYNNNSPWAEIADGDGPSLILCDANTDNDDPANWGFSTNNTGLTAGGGNDIIFASPGAANTCPTGPYIFFNGTTDVTNEGAGTDNFAVRMANTGMADTADVDVIVMTGASTATDGIDYTVLNTTLHFSPDGIGEVSVAFIEMALLDDLEIEPDETVVMQLANPTMGATIATDGLFTVTIEDNDGITFPSYPIGTVTSTDADGVVDSLGVTCSLTGVVHGVNMRPDGLQFTFIDQNNDGIGLFHSSGNFGYTVTEGDLVTVEGTINQFNGLAQIAPDTVMLISGGNPLWFPDLVTSLSEATESQMTRMNCMSLVDASQWTNMGSGFNVDITDGVNTVQMRIDADVDIFGTAAPTGMFDVIGIGGQFDSSSPYDEGYQLLPRYMADIIANNCGPGTVNANDDNVSTNANTSVNINVLANDNIPGVVASIAVIDNVVFGTLTLNGDFSFEYTPDLDFCGIDAFSYQVCDDMSVCDTASVVINVICPTNYPLYEIGDITTTNNAGEPDSLGVVCEIRGIVYGVNLRASGLQFTIIDPDDKEDGIGNFLANGNFGYTVTEGDEVGVFGTVGFFNGLTQMEIDSVYLISANNPLHAPDPVTMLDESTESKLVKIFNLSFTDLSQWTNMGNGFNVDVTDGSNTYQVRIDNDVDIFGTNPPSAPFNVTGIGGQFDSSSPYNSGYQLLPRYLPDFEPYIGVGTEDIDLENKVHVYPNPASNVLFVGMEVQVDQMHLSNMLGQRISTVVNPAHNEMLDVSNFSAGIYLITFEKDGYRWTQEWVKQ